MTDAMPEFPDFYRAINDRDPFPWQARLAEQVAAEERWPSEIGVPTGLGKTACLEIAVWWLASQAHRPPVERTAPTRLWWVVNRRLLVDSTTDHARSLADLLDGSGSKVTRDQDRSILQRVADRLRLLSADRDAPPLEVISLRGGVASRTPTDPSRPAVVLCTLPMYGSRLLFRGYGSSLRAVDAAMAGTDSLVLLDEAHLAPHLRSLVGALADCAPGAQPTLPGPRGSATMVALTATGDVNAGERFDLTDADERNPVVRARLDAVKATSLRVEAKGGAAEHLAKAAEELIEEASGPSSFLVFANSPKTGREVFQRLRKRTAGHKPMPDLILLTGLTREREAERIRARILDPAAGMAAARSATPRERHLIVVATQTLEVGADIDAEYLVTEACGVRALTQRLGRLNRLGRLGHARAVYVHVPVSGRGGGPAEAQAPPEWPVYGKEPTAVLERLQSASVAGGAINLSPRRVAEVLGPPDDHPGRAPELLPGILWEWVKTTTPPEGEAPVEPYFAGIAAPPHAASVIWRIHVPEVGERLWPRATDREAVDVPLRELREALAVEEPVLRLSSDAVTVESTASAGLRPGDQVVLPTDRGLLDPFGWDASATEPVVDASLDGRGLPLDASAIERLCGLSVGHIIRKALSDGDEAVGDAQRDEAVRELLDAIRDIETPAAWDSVEWSDLVDSLEPQIVAAPREVPRLRVRNPHPELRIGEFDETSLGATAQLDPHGDAVGLRAEVVAACMGVPQTIRDVVTLAGKLHDIGKADRRFQRWLDPEGAAGVLVAKSNAPRHRWEAMRADAGWPRGGRHEDLSARLVRSWLNDEPEWGGEVERDLLIHLVISHHGNGRPLVPPAKDGTGATVCGVVSGTRVEVAADLAIVDWDQPARFRRLNNHFGPWGLALLEAIVIRSDHAVSARGDVDLEMP